MKGPPEYQPSAQEIAAQKAAENDKIEGIQGRLQDDTERLFRIFGAKSALSGKSALGKI